MPRKKKTKKRKSTRKTRKRKTIRRKTTRKTTKRKKRKRKKHNFPKNPRKGQRKTITVRGRKVTFEATGKKGFGAWRIVSNK